MSAATARSRAVEFIPQLTETDCGAACLASVLSFHGKHVPLHEVRNLQVTPRVASTTRESRIRSAWAVARRIDELLSVTPARSEFRPTAPDDPVDLRAGEAPA